MKRLATIVLSVSAISFVLSAYFYFNMIKLLPKTKNQLAEPMSFFDHDTANYDIVFIGSSRIYAHVNPRIIDSVCHSNSICLNLSGTTITQHLAILEKYLQKHTNPKLIVLGLDYQSLQASMIPFKYPDYYDYLGDSVFGRLNQQAIFKFRFPCLFSNYDRFIEYSAKTDYQKSASLITALKIPKKFDHLEDASTGVDPVTYKGFAAITRSWSNNSTAEIQGTETLIYQPMGEEFLQQFIVVAKSHAPHVLIIFTPAYKGLEKRYTNNREFTAELDSIISRNKVPFWDFRDEPLCNDTAYFANAWHMNAKGAAIFSETLASRIKKLISN